MDINLHDINGNTPLHLAASYGCSCVTSIIDWKGDIEALNNKGNTPLHEIVIKEPDNII